jgi:type II restriction/modification system DNA methylase subunit YeeA
MPSLTPQQFVAQWRNTELKERQSYQAHFIALCELIGVPPPTGSGTDAKGRKFQFEPSIKQEGGGQGFADVWYEGHFAMEYKAPGKYKSLDDAYAQLKRYREALNNPPLLIVTDIHQWEVHTNFTNAAHTVHKFSHDDIDQLTTSATSGRQENRALRLLRAMFTDPNSLHPDRTTAQVTEAAAREFVKIADAMRGHETSAAPERIAHFLTKIVFCLFAEDVGLLPISKNGHGLFTEIVERTYREPSRFVKYMKELFEKMAEGGDHLLGEVRYFNGKLFEDVTVEELPFEALTTLRDAAKLDWSNVEPAIFGTLFERSLDPAKRSQLGAHYTSPADIDLIITPVLIQPLRAHWQSVQAQAAPLRAQYNAAQTTRDKSALQKQLEALRGGMLARLREIKVLDPACGSGNFLYISLRALLDLEKEVILSPFWNGDGFTQPFPEVHPSQMYGIEINPIAHDLATIVVWIGWIQWKVNNGYDQYPTPVLESLGENIRQMDAILAYAADGTPTEPEWPPVEVIVGNPPFLGGSLIRGQLGEEYQSKIWGVYAGRVPGFGDLVCYWFERARTEIERGRVKRAGLLSTNSIRGGANREVLKRIKDTGDIFMAWSDREWVLDGAAVRVSMIGFDDGTQHERTLDGQIALDINSDLTSQIDITKALILDENNRICLHADKKHGAFDITYEQAQVMLGMQNASGRANSDVIRPYYNARDIVTRPKFTWIIDFFTMSLEEAELYEEPLRYVRTHVKPERDNNNRRTRRERWWHHGETVPGMRNAIVPLSRFIATPAVAKHRIFVWLDKNIIPDHAAFAIARDDDYFFGVLHSRLHEVWSLRMGTSLEDRPRYTPTTTFETFPFPYLPGAEPTAAPEYREIAAAAAALHAERDAWLNPPALVGNHPPHTPLPDKIEAQLKDRTLTNLYNALAVFRGTASGAVKRDAGDFAPRLDELHRKLDVAVCAAYGWDIAILDDEEAMLAALLALNLARAAGQGL